VYDAAAYNHFPKESGFFVLGDKDKKLWAIRVFKIGM
jgi:hypothetical protein